MDAGRTPRIRLPFARVLRWPLSHRIAMDRLPAELLRLYLMPSGSDAAGAESNRPDGPVRAFMVALSRPADWNALAPLWRGVQAELGWPAPAIAVSGGDALQLWFSLAHPVPVTQAADAARRLRAHFLADLADARVQWWPDAAGTPMPPLPGRPVAPERWSAFVAPDLAPVFDDTPWLDIPPGDEAQVGLLAGLRSIAPRDFDEGLQRLRTTVAADPAVASPSAPERTAPPAAPTPSPAGFTDTVDPLRFLQQVMADAAVPLALRIEAAKALLPYTARRSD